MSSRRGGGDSRSRPGPGMNGVWHESLLVDGMGRDGSLPGLVVAVARGGEERRGSAWLLDGIDAIVITTYCLSGQGYGWFDATPTAWTMVVRT